MLVIENLGLGCIETFMPELASNKEFLEKVNPENIILKLSSLNPEIPFFKMYDYLDKMTVILSAHTLRERGAAISEGLSWDQTIEDTILEFESGLSQLDLALCRRVVVLFSAEGAAVFERKVEETRVQLHKFLYHPSQYEGSFKANHPGQMSGNLSLVTAAVIRHLVLGKKDYPLFVALSLALTAIRKQYEEGFQENEEAKKPGDRFDPTKHIESLCAILTLTDCLLFESVLVDGNLDPSKCPNKTKMEQEKKGEIETKILEHKSELDKRVVNLLKKMTNKIRLKIAGEALPRLGALKIDLALVENGVRGLDGLISQAGTEEEILKGLVVLPNLLDLSHYLVLMDQEEKIKKQKKELFKYLETFSCAFRHGLLEYPPKNDPGKSNLLRDATGYSCEYVAAKAFQIVMQGAKGALSNVPIASYGDLLTADREEIERINAIRKLIIAYQGNPQDKKPLSLAVFSPPGSGKSFSIKQLAAELGFTDKSIHTFNLSEFKTSEELHVAFHIVRDATIQGEIPLIFWDEFDSNGLDWLKEFLAPMQDAEFRAGSVVHPLGKSIFVFAGGVFSSFEEFEEKTLKDESSTNPYKGKKAPDFISRLRGYVNIKGPNPQDGGDINDEYLIRRAILLRSVLERNFGHLLGAKGQAAISAPLVQAFLRVDEYKHGARSLESIVTMSDLVKAPYFGEAALPPDHLLNLHVNAKKFRDIMSQAALDAPLIEMISEACHMAWMEGKRLDDYVYGPVRSDDPPKTHPLIKEYHELDENGKEGNRITARVTPAKLKEARLRIVQPTTGQTAPNIAPFDKKIEHLKRIEHDVWMRDHLLKGYELSGKTVDVLKLHRCVARFDELTDEDKKLDDAIVNSLMGILVKNGYGVIDI